MNGIVYIILEEYIGSMRWVSAIIAICITMVSLNTASALSGDLFVLETLIANNEDTRINSQDLAFFLATHNYNATPVDGYVELNLNGKICKLIPNGDKPGLCDIMPGRVMRGKR